MAISAGRPIRITHCIGRMWRAGAEKQLSELMLRLPRDRFEQSLVLIEGGGEILPRIIEAGIPVVELDYRMRYRKYDPRFFFAMARALVKFVRHLRAFRPDILHAQLFWANVLGAAAGRLAGTPTIITSRLQLSDYKQGKPWMQKLENAANRATTAVFANSEAVRRDALAHERINPAIIRVVYNGVVLEDFKSADMEAYRKEFKLSPGDLAVVAVANLHPYKGHEDLLRAAISLAPRHPGLKLILPGRDRGMRSALEKLAREHGMEERILFPGEREDIPQLLQLADIVVHPSHQEGFSNSILEGMTAGKPMVVTNVGGNPEAVRDGAEGFVVPPRDPQALATAIEKLLNDAELRGRMGRAARRRIEDEFSMPIMIERFASWYEELAAAGRR